MKHSQKNKFNECRRNSRLTSLVYLSTCRWTIKLSWNWISRRVTNQKLFNRYGWHSGRSIVRSLSLFFLSPLPSCKAMRQSWESGGPPRTTGGLEGTNGGCPEGTLTQAPLLSETIASLLFPPLPPMVLFPLSPSPPWLASNIVA